MLEAAVESAFPDSPVIPSNPLVIPSEAKESFLASADFIRFTSTPAGNCYSFSDSYRKATGQYMQAWMLTRTGDPTLLHPELRIMEMTDYKRLCEERLFPMFLISLSRAPGFEITPPQDHYYQCGGTMPIFVYRSGWTSRDDDYLGVKGGLAMSSHSHIDQGSFLFESDGVAWATDLGMQDYNSLESAGVDLWDMLQDSERWTVFRIGPMSHNILTVNGKVPKVNKAVDFLRTRKPAHPSPADPASAQLYLRPMYDDDLAYYVREVQYDGSDLIVLDNLQAGDTTCTVRWAMCSETEAMVSADGSFLLRANGHERTLSAQINGFDAPLLTPHIWPTTYDPAALDVDGMQYLHPTDVPNPGTSLVGYTFTLQPGQKAVLRVKLSR
jgi:hypothetical protein